jgi:hypothetical protein
MRLNKALEDKKMDVRLRDKLLGEGKLTVSEVDVFLKALSDDQEGAEFSSLDSNESKPQEEAESDSSATDEGESTPVLN